jgi:hypothetical protein
MHRLSSLKLVIVSIFFALTVSACATSRSVITVEAPAGEQPKSSHFAKITDVRDLRQFSVNPGDPSQPSLGSEEDIRDPKIIGRAVGRKRNGYGMALGDVAVQEGTSVAGLVRDAARKALQDRGYVVVEQNSPQYSGALPLTLDVQQFWTWISLGMFEGTFTLDATVGMNGNGLVAANPTVIKSQTVVTLMAGTDAIWTRTVQTGLNDLVEKMKAQIKAPPASPGVSQSDGTEPNTANLGF